MREPIHKGGLLAVLLTILAFNYVDRLALGLLLQNIKVDLSLSDTQLGLLGGLSFALFYSVMGIPIARWADRGNRVTIITLTTAIWSAAVALCGLAGSFLQLMLIRIGVAVGEAGCIPPAHSLIADYFPRAQRPRAVAIYMLGKPLSILIGYLLAGWLNELYGWRMTFILLGLPGLALAVLARFALVEPRKEKAFGKNASLSQAISPSLKETWATLWGNGSYRHVLFCFALLTFFSYGIWQWAPAFFIRSFNLQTGELGTWFAGIWGVGGLLGTYLGGEWASRHATNNEPLQLKVMAGLYASFAVLSSLIYLSPSHYLAFALMGLAAAGTYAIYGPLFATIQTLVPERMRAMSIAVIYLFANLIGMGLGPFVVGVLSDALSTWAGQESLRYALLVLCPGYVWCGWHLWQASKSIARDLKRA